MQKIIFLDIDGPVIPAPVYFIDMNCSWDRSVVSTNAIGWLRRLIKLSDAFVVGNSYHNFMNSGGKNNNDQPERDLRVDLIRHGLPFD